MFVGSLLLLNCGKCSESLGILTHRLYEDGIISNFQMKRLRLGEGKVIVQSHQVGLAGLGEGHSRGSSDLPPESMQASTTLSTCPEGHLGRALQTLGLATKDVHGRVWPGGSVI